MHEVHRDSELQLEHPFEHWVQDFRIVSKYYPCEHVGNFVESKQKLFTRSMAVVGRSAKSIRSNPVNRLF